MNRPSPLFTLLFALVLTFSGCGGGGGSTSQSNSGSGSGVTTTPNIVINTGSQLPNALQGQPYSVTFSASNNQGALKWGISPYSPTVQYADGLSIDPATGVLSGNPTFAGTAMFYINVIDANSRTASNVVTLNSFGKLAAGAPNNFTNFQFQDFFISQLNVQGGVPPLHFVLASGSIPPGLKFNDSGQVQGYALQPGNYTAVMNVSDSWSPAEVVQQTVNFKITAANLILNSDVQGNMPVNQPVHYALYANGGVPPYIYSISSGYVLPSGMTLDSSTGKFMGSPTTTGNYFFVANVKDSVGNFVPTGFSLTVVPSHGRNDSVQTATLFQSNVSASLSPYIDPPDKAPLAADNDYYKLVSMAGSTIHLSMQVQGGPIDPVIEVLDANGIRLSTCNSVDYTATNYSSACINDEDGQGGHNAALDYKVPGNPGDIVNSYVHAFDWSGNARPDMFYSLTQSGNAEPTFLQLPATHGWVYSYQLISPYALTNGANWTVDSGSLPPGLTLSSAGVISGTPTTAGTYQFRLKVTDTVVQTQVYYVFVTMQVG